MPEFDAESLILRPAMLRVLLRQRTHYAWRFHKVARHYLSPVKLYRAYWRFIAPTIERIRLNSISMMYRNELNKEFGEIRAHLPGRGSSILDIGCGLAGIDVRLYRHYQGNALLHLLDTEGVTETRYGAQEQEAYKADLTRKFLLDNGIAEKDAFFYDAQKDEFPVDIKFDLIISLLSWGFHYPIGTYLDRVADCLRPGGKLIVDVRKETTGFHDLSRRFQKILIVGEHVKRLRVLAEH